MHESLDQVQLDFSPESLFFLNIVLGFIMFGVALELKLDDFRQILIKPKGPIVGVISQFILLPALTFCLIWLMKVEASMALGMILVAACPGGNISNFISLLAKGNVALSVTLTAIATLLAIVMTPFNFTFWGSLYPPSAKILTKISLDPIEMFTTVLFLLGIPLILGMWTTHQFPQLTKKIIKPIKILSIIIFAAFVVVALYNNFGYFLEYIHIIILIVFLHNAIAFIGGYGFAKLLGLDQASARSITIETGIQNSGLALVLIFGFFGGLGGMALIAAWWGIWHIVTGLSLAFVWSKLT